ncbi:non-canonical purine NTP diphosphatase [Flavobacterium sp. xlx-214]|uniref:non-canonical purine NTP diphosphatase n=1 Tax=unclassified Flavobacterium TaxID=196869 RepID=UPI0013D3F77A|nr:MULTISPECIES: non-canonical purine NTP diphosphatase [unclassified Flavobacterium]MBA5791324.1 non-canonical purine NTP diphosphatase [Flavobacterium sp. xlx-221]QMI83518.1 non-canonical purine NTP diphosphatase [Flavobacterium sp. xlx-214]
MKIIFASNNKNKVQEIQNQVPKSIQIVTLEEIGCTEDIEETATTIEGNAIIKANYITEKYGLPCFADDTGLEIEALNGEPGVYSARYAGEDKNADKNMDLVLEKLSTSTNRNAQFKTVIALNIDNQQILFTGIVEGKIRNEKTGTNGFGYDPIFEPENLGKTFAEMTMEEKNKMSHRGRAVEQLVIFLSKIENK